MHAHQWSLKFKEKYVPNKKTSTIGSIGKLQSYRKSHTPHGGRKMELLTFHSIILIAELCTMSLIQNMCKSMLGITLGRTSNHRYCMWLIHWHLECLWLGWRTSALHSFGHDEILCSLNWISPENKHLQEKIVRNQLQSFPMIETQI